MTNEERLIPYFAELHGKVLSEDFLIDKTGVKVVELISPRIELDPSQSFLDFGVRRTPLKYALEEISWYDSQDLSVKDIGKQAKIWNHVCDENGNVHSNYGYLIYSKELGSQYVSAIDELKRNKDSRRSCMIYNRPSMQWEYNLNGMSDFICTYATQHFIRNGELVYVVYMRSNDAIFGFFNDFYWHCTVYERMLKDLDGIKYGSLIWNSGSWHVYERHFELLKQMVEEKID